MKKKGISCLCLFFVAIAHAQIYKWTDGNGTVHYSDVPQPGAQKIDLPEVQTSTPSPPPAEEPPVKLAPKKAPFEYKSVEIVQPKNEETLRNNQGFVPVVVNITPELQKGNLMQLIYDGSPLGDPQPAKVFAINDSLRGTHTLAVQVLNADGEVAITSDPITFYMQRPRVGMVSGQAKAGP